MDMNNPSKLLTLAHEAAANADAPYSHFQVGAAILSDSGKYYSGCNVENISFPTGSCAEQSAVSAMICGGDICIAEILIYADSKKLITPCGACLQRIAEFSTPKTLIHLANTAGIKETLSINDLLPHCFKEF